eukprot:s3502_g4.t3
MVPLCQSIGAGLEHDCSTWDEIYENDGNDAPNAWNASKAKASPTAGGPRSAAAAGTPESLRQLSAFGICGRAPATELRSGDGDPAESPLAARRGRFRGAASPGLLSLAAARRQGAGSDRSKLAHASDACVAFVGMVGGAAGRQGAPDCGLLFGGSAMGPGPAGCFIRPQKPKMPQSRDRTPPKSRPPDGAAVDGLVAASQNGVETAKSGPDELPTPKIIKKGTRSAPKRPQGSSTFGMSQENETVAGWVEHDTRIRRAMPLNPTSREEAGKADLAVHPALEAARAKGKRFRGVKRYAGIGAQASSVDQVIFGRDMDFSGEGDGTDLAEYDGRAGISSQSVPRAGGVKKVFRGGCRHSPGNSNTTGGPVSPNQSHGVAEVFGGSVEQQQKQIQAARVAVFGRDSAGAPSWKSAKATKQDGRGGADLVGAVVFGQAGAGPPETLAASRSKRRVDPKVCFVDTAGQTSAEIHVDKGKRVGTQYKDTSGSAGCCSENLCTLQAGWHPEARDRLVKAASGFHEPACAMKCTTDKVVYGQLTPRQSEPLWAERKANILREYPGRKHLRALGMPFMAQQADIFSDGSRRTATPPSSSASGLATSMGQNRSVASLFEGSAGKPTALAEWDQPRPTRARTPPARPAGRRCAEAEGPPGSPSAPSGQVRRKGAMPTERQHPLFGSNVACLLGEA